MRVRGVCIFVRLIGRLCISCRSDCSGFVFFGMEVCTVEVSTDRSVTET